MERVREKEGEREGRERERDRDRDRKKTICPAGALRSARLHQITSWLQSHLDVDVSMKKECSNAI